MKLILLEVVMDTAFDTVSTKSKIHILLPSKVHIVLKNIKQIIVTCYALAYYATKKNVER